MFFHRLKKFMIILRKLKNDNVSDIHNFNAETWTDFEV